MLSEVFYLIERILSVCCRMARSMIVRIGRSRRLCLHDERARTTASAKYSCSSSSCRAVRRFCGL
jgi:hypothetical protein